jgi:hypothetical protein
LSEKQSIELQFAPSSQGDYRVPGLRENVKEIPVKPAVAYPASRELRRVTLFAFIHGFIPVAFCEGG